MKPYYEDSHVTIYHGDCRELLPELDGHSVDCCITSPPYWGLRDYGNTGQMGLEKTPEEYTEQMVDVFSGVRAAMCEGSTLWLNLGDSYNAYNGGAGPGSKLSKTQTEQRPALKTGYGLQCKSLKPKDLVGIPWRVAFALQADGWWLRQDIIWNKPNPMPESVQDRCTKAHEYIFLLSNSERYQFDNEAIKEQAISEYPSGNGYARPERLSFINSDGTPRGQQEGWDNVGGKRNKRSVWTVSPATCKAAHFAVFPPDLITPCLLAGCEEGGVVLDPFLGSGTTAAVARRNGCHCIGIELNEEYCEIAAERMRQGVLF